MTFAPSAGGGDPVTNFGTGRLMFQQEFPFAQAGATTVQVATVPFTVGTNIAFHTYLTILSGNTDDQDNASQSVAMFFRDSGGDLFNTGNEDIVYGFGAGGFDLSAIVSVGADSMRFDFDTTSVGQTEGLVKITVFEYALPSVAISGP